MECAAPEFWSKYTTDKVKGDRMIGNINRMGKKKKDRERERERERERARERERNHSWVIDGQA